jgi:hypothetical protein
VNPPACFASLLNSNGAIFGGTAKTAASSPKKVIPDNQLANFKNSNVHLYSIKGD